MTELMDMEAVVEAILFVATEPVSRPKLLEVFGEKEQGAAEAALDAVVERYRERDGGGIVIDEVAGGLRLVSRPDLHGYLRRFFEVTGTNKLSMPALETLAIIAYRQPVTAPEISELRGVSSAGVLKKLLERRLVRISGRKEVVGKPFLYATTREFLMHFGLRGLKELPPLEQFEEMFAGDAEASAEDAEPDTEETVLREAAELEAAEAEAADREEAEAIEREREEAEALEAAGGDEPESEAVEPPAAASVEVGEDDDDTDSDDEAAEPRREAP
ncbi:MAG: SMC-Scp complex subunit ScpB [Acidobacteriota bacterium]